MNLYFLKIGYKNFLSTGNLMTEIDLTENKMTLVVGDNGAGKSTMLDALCFVLFNKPFRKINKPQLCNSATKKDCLGYVEFKTRGAHYKVVRGMRPNVFEIWKNGVLINQDAKNTDYQAHLEKHILKTNFKTFCQIVILGSASFVPFMQLPGGQRREITEDVLDLKIFTSMNTILKTRFSYVEKLIQDRKREKDVLDAKIKMAKKHTEQLAEEKQKQIWEKEEKITALYEERQDHGIAIHQKTKEVDALLEQITDFHSLDNRAKKMRSIRNQLDGKISSLLQDVKFLNDHDNCPTCNQEINGSFKECTLSSKKDAVAETEAGLKLLGEQYSKVEERLREITAVNKKVADINVEIYVLGTKIDTIDKYIRTLEREIEALDVEQKEISGESLDDLESDLKELEIEKKELENQLYMMEYVSVLLKDTGIKAKIIKQYVPIINKLINKYLASLDFFVDFNMDENFEETIKSRGRDDFSYNSFSEGEKMRIDLAVLFAWRAVAKLRSSINTNLLIMDEVFDSSLDATGIEEFMKILGKVTEDNNVFVISHKADQLYDQFEKVIKFEKHNNFSKMVQ
jgi:DNA repair exonuclease SbcCD ATPase subunit